MRISDWSSDVCSSDLFAEFDALAFENVRKLQAVAAEIGLQRTHRRAHLLRAHFDRAVAGRQRAAHVVFDAIDDGRARRSPDAIEITTEQAEQQQIGRASCRERVCQYV